MDEKNIRAIAVRWLLDARALVPSNRSVWGVARQANPPSLTVTAEVVLALLEARKHAEQLNIQSNELSDAISSALDWLEAELIARIDRPGDVVDLPNIVFAIRAHALGREAFGGDFIERSVSHLMKFRNQREWSYNHQFGPTTIFAASLALCALSDILDHPSVPNGLSGKILRQCENACHETRDFLLTTHAEKGWSELPGGEVSCTITALAMQALLTGRHKELHPAERSKIVNSALFLGEALRRDSLEWSYKVSGGMYTALSAPNVIFALQHFLSSPHKNERVCFYRAAAHLTSANRYVIDDKGVFRGFRFEETDYNPQFVWPTAYAVRALLVIPQPSLLFRDLCDFYERENLCANGKLIAASATGQTPALDRLDDSSKRADDVTYRVRSVPLYSVCVGIYFAILLFVLFLLLKLIIPRIVESHWRLVVLLVWALAAGLAGCHIAWLQERRELWLKYAAASFATCATIALASLQYLGFPSTTATEPKNSPAISAAH